MHDVRTEVVEQPEQPAQVPRRQRHRDLVIHAETRRWWRPARQAHYPISVSPLFARGASIRGGDHEYVVAKLGELAGQARGVVRAAARTWQEKVVRHHDAHDSALIPGELRPDGEHLC